MWGPIELLLALFAAAATALLLGLFAHDAMHAVTQYLGILSRQ
jgi:hypothetical protein